jgi:hypothetical protein
MGSIAVGILSATIIAVSSIAKPLIKKLIKKAIGGIINKFKRKLFGGLCLMRA